MNLCKKRLNEFVRMVVDQYIQSINCEKEEHRKENERELILLLRVGCVLRVFNGSLYSELMAYTLKVLEIPVKSSEQITECYKEIRDGLRMFMTPAAKKTLGEE